MRNKLSLFLSIILVVSGIILYNFIMYQHSKIKDLQKQISGKDIQISEIKSDVIIALKLLKVRTWYVVHKNKVSSLPNGRGEVVELLDRPLLPVGNRLGIRHPIPNTKIMFLPNKPESFTGAYVVAGGFVTYEYSGK